MSALHAAEIAGSGAPERAWAGQVGAQHSHVSAASMSMYGAHKLH